MSETWKIFLDYDSSFNETVKGFNQLSRNTDRAFDSFIQRVSTVDTGGAQGSRSILDRVFSGATAGLFARGMGRSLRNKKVTTGRPPRQWIPDDGVIYRKIKEPDVGEIFKPRSPSMRKGIWASGINPTVVTPSGIFQSRRNGIAKERLDRVRRFYDPRHQEDYLPAAQSEKVFQIDPGLQVGDTTLRTLKMKRFIRTIKPDKPPTGSGILPVGAATREMGNTRQAAFKPEPPTDGMGIFDFMNRPQPDATLMMGPATVGIQTGMGNSTVRRKLDELKGMVNKMDETVKKLDDTTKRSR